MNNTEPGKPESKDDVPLNPALKKEHDDSYSSADQHGTDPMATVSVQSDEGKAWPWVWAVVTIVCVIVTLYIFIF